MFEKVTEKIENLNLPIGEYVIFGSAPIVAHGLREFNHDVDILVSDKIWQEYKNKPDWKLKTFERDGRVVEELENLDGNIELYHNWAPGEWDKEKLFKEAEIIDGLSYAGLEDVLKWKKISARKKDLEDAKIIENHLNSK